MNKVRAPFVNLGFRFGVASLETLKNDGSGLVALQVHKDVVQRGAGRNRHLLNIKMFTVIRHQNRARSIRTPLVHSPALRRGQDFTLVGVLHLTSNSQFEIVQHAERSGGEHAHRGAARQPFLGWECRFEIVNHNP